MPEYITYALHHDESPHVYVGKSSSGFIRPRQHGLPAYMKMHAHLPVIKWISKLRKSGKEFEIVVLEKFDSINGLDESERFHIANFKAIGMSLLNLTEGGDGAYGRVLSDESRNKIVNSLKKFTKTEEGQANLAVRNARRRAVKQSPEVVARMSASGKARSGTVEGHAHMKAMSARRHSPEISVPTAIKIGNTLRGRPLAEETKNKLSIANTGKTHSLESRQKISAGNKGKIVSQETKDKLSAANKGKKRSLECLEEMAARSRGVKQAPETIAKRLATRRANIAQKKREE